MVRLRYLFGALIAFCAACASHESVLAPERLNARFLAGSEQNYTAAVLANGATQYFPLNETSGPTAFDRSPSKINGAYVGAIAYNVAGPLTNQPSKAIALAGGSKSAGVQLPGPGIAGSGSYTIQTWVLPLSTNAYATIWGASGSHRLLLNPQGLLLSQFGGNFISKTVLTPNQWHDVVFEYDAAAQTETYYIDGKQDATAALRAENAAFTTPYYLGQYDTSPNYKWNGDLADHAFYPSALTAAQVAMLHATAGYPAPTPTIEPTPTPTPSLRGVTVAHFTSTFSYGGAMYTYRMVGSNPRTAASLTTVGVQIIPVRLVFSNGVVLDPTAAAATVPHSPLFANGSYPVVGNTQYGDAFMRSQFWRYAVNSGYHVLLRTPPVLESTLSVNVPSADGYTLTSGGQVTGYATYAWFVQTIEPQILAQLHVDPRTLSIISTTNFKVIQPGGICCYEGYHSAFEMNTSFGPSIVTTAWASVSLNGVLTLSHEVGEWLADPFYTNVVPGWLDPVSSGCNGDLLEVGDPVTFSTFAVNGSTVQDLAFYSWFSRDVPSIGVNGQYDFTGKLVHPATSC